MIVFYKVWQWPATPLLKNYHLLLTSFVDERRCEQLCWGGSALQTFLKLITQFGIKQIFNISRKRIPRNQRLEDRIIGFYPSETSLRSTEMITTICSKSDRKKSEYNPKFKHSFIISTFYAMRWAKTFLICNAKWLKPIMILIVISTILSTCKARMFQKMFSKVVS